LVFPALERVSAGLARALTCPRFPGIRPAGLVAFPPSAGKPAPTVHGEPPQLRLTTGSWQQLLRRVWEQVKDTLKNSCFYHSRSSNPLIVHTLR